MKARERLAHTLKVRFGLPPDRPTDAELNQIIAAVPLLEAKLARSLTDHDWRLVAYHFVEFDSKYIYEGLNFQDLNALFAMIRAQSSSQRK